MNIASVLRKYKKVIRALNETNDERNECEDKLIYRAELKAVRPFLDRFRSFGSIGGAETYLRGILASPPIRESFPKANLASVALATAGRPPYKKGTRVYLVRYVGLIREWLALHELAHLLADSEGGDQWPDSSPCDGYILFRTHGPKWRAVYAGLVSAFVGEDVGRSLTEHFARIDGLSAA